MLEHTQIPQRSKHAMLHYTMESNTFTTTSLTYVSYTERVIPLGNTAVLGTITPLDQFYTAFQPIVNITSSTVWRLQFVFIPADGSSNITVEGDITNTTSNWIWNNANTVYIRKEPYILTNNIGGILLQIKSSTGGSISVDNLGGWLYPRIV